MEAALKLGQARLCAPTLENDRSQGALLILTPITSPHPGRIRKQTEIMIEALESMDGVSLPAVQAAVFYATARLPVDNAEDFAIWLLTDFELEGKTVMLAPVEELSTKNPGGHGARRVRVAYFLEASAIPGGHAEYVKTPWRSTPAAGKDGPMDRLMTWKAP